MPGDRPDDPTGDASTDDRRTAPRRTDDRGIDDRIPATDGGSPPVLDREIPDPLGERLTTLFGREVETFADWSVALRAAVEETEGRPPDAGDLCHTDGSDHVARIDGEIHAFLCPLDALLYPHLVGERATVETVTPSGETLTARVDPGEGADLEGADPGEAVVSLGAPLDTGEVACCAECASPSDYEALCAYVRAFPDRAGYEDWADGDASEAATTALPFDEAVELTRSIGVGWGS